MSSRLVISQVVAHLLGGHDIPVYPYDGSLGVYVFVSTRVFGRRRLGENVTKRACSAPTKRLPCEC